MGRSLRQNGGQIKFYISSNQNIRIVGTQHNLKLFPASDVKKFLKDINFHI